jgi:hypothetical protein
VIVSWTRLFAAVVGVSVVCVGARADMMPVSAVNADFRQEAYAASVVDRQPTYSAGLAGVVDRQPTYSAGLFDYATITDLRIEPTKLSPEAGEELDKLFLTQNVQILTERQDSLHLCLSAFAALALCGSRPCLKKLSVGFIPEWYHNGGPFLIGRGLAVSPDCVCPVPVYCFVQPTYPTEDRIPQYRSGTIVSLWRRSQFTPDVLAARGPPVTC